MQHELILDKITSGEISTAFLVMQIESFREQLKRAISYLIDA
jgi:hypothetical protein